jgi:hypothetical protein
MCRKTKSEMLFEQFCLDNGIKCQRIKEQESKSPDYEAWFGEHRMIVEVKQLDESKTDRQIRNQGRKRGIASYWDDPGRRVRIKIDSARKQLKALSDGIHPTLFTLRTPSTLSGCVATP